MDEALLTALRWRREGRQVALATVLETWGSAPRPAGSCMVVDAEGSFEGSVSGGCVETAVVSEAGEVLDGGGPRTLEFGVADEDAWAVGLPCGGRIRVGLERLDDTAAEVMRRAVEECRTGCPVVLASDPTDSRRWLLRPRSAAGQRPDGAGGTAEDDGADTGSSAVLASTPGAGPFPQALLEAAADACRLDRSGTRRAGDREYFLQALGPPLRMIIVGAVHIAQALAPMARHAGFGVTVVDPRRSFAAGERFPDVELRTAWPDRALPELRPDARTAVVVLAHDPKLDDPALIAALRSPAYYIGALGSRRTQEARRKRLREAGFDDDALARIHGPVGLDLGGRSPAEIAVAVLAEAVAVLRKEEPADR